MSETASAKKLKRRLPRSLKNKNVSKIQETQEIQAVSEEKIIQKSLNKINQN